VNALVYTVGVVVFAFGVLASIALHELGHLYPAKKFGVKVTQYFVGFGKTVWSVRRGETEYGLKAFPLGGFVKLVGMLPPAKDDAEGTVRWSPTPAPPRTSTSSPVTPIGSSTASRGGRR
jgi:membrane-associated protease RseP (regulator of RpoE activity)